MLKKYKGSGLVILALVGAAVVGITSLSIVKASSVALAGFRVNSDNILCQEYASSEAYIIKFTPYSDLSSKSRCDIQNSNGFQCEVILSTESDYSETIKEKTATVNIYRTGDASPRVTLDVKKYNQELQPISGVPIGTIIAWPGSSAPTENGTWLLCNGQSCVSYPALSAIVGSTVPNLNGRFLEGTTGTPRSFKDAGLPNIYGTFVVDSNAGVCSGPFYYGQIYGGQGGGSSGKGKLCTFDPSLYNSIYGASDTVQVPSFTVNYYIKAA